MPVKKDNGVCPKHNIPYEKMGYGERLVCPECHKENIEKYFESKQPVQDGKK